MKYIIDLYTSKKKLWMHRYDFKEINTETNRYYRIKVEKEDRKKILRKIKWRGMKYRCYEERWGRSNDYRRKFLKEYQPPYRCIYCNKRLKEENMVVDHIIPVAKVKKNNNHARMWLAFQGIGDVNDLRNLAPSCRKCNDAKKDKMGIWILKAWLGKYTFYWKIKPFLVWGFWTLFVYYLYINDFFVILYEFISKLI